MKSLQNQYNLIKEGRGNKEIFLKEAKAQFPQYITNVQTFDQVIHSLTEKGIINEAMVLVSANRPTTPDWFKVFNENVKAELKETDETVEEMETKGYDYKDSKNNNNISTAEILTGYYAEMKDPKNAEKTETEIKAIVFKNLEKDPLYYVKDGQFGIKGLGYTEDHPGLGPTKEVTGKYKSSGMEPVKLNEVFYGDSDRDYDADQEDEQMAYYYYDKGLEAYSEGDYLKADKYYTTALRYGSSLGFTEVDLPPYEKATGSSLEEGEEEKEYIIYTFSYNTPEDKEIWDNTLRTRRDAKLRVNGYNMDTQESDRYGTMTKSEWEAQYGPLSEHRIALSEAKKRAIEKHIKEIEKMGEVAAWEHRIGKIQEKIEELTNKMTVTEGDDVKEYVDKKLVGELKKDIKLLEKKKALYEKQKAKAAKKVTDKSAMQSAAGEGATVMEKEEKPHTPPTDPDRERAFASMKRDTAPKPKKESWSGMVRELINQKNLKLK